MAIHLNKEQLSLLLCGKMATIYGRHFIGKKVALRAENGCKIIAKCTGYWSDDLINYKSSFIIDETEIELDSEDYSTES